MLHSRSSGRFRIRDSTAPMYYPVCRPIRRGHVGPESFARRRTMHECGEAYEG